MASHQQNLPHPQTPLWTLPSIPCFNQNQFKPIILTSRESLPSHLSYLQCLRWSGLFLIATFRAFFSALYCPSFESPARAVMVNSSHSLIILSPCTWLSLFPTTPVLFLVVPSSCMWSFKFLAIQFLEFFSSKNWTVHNHILRNLGIINYFIPSKIVISCILILPLINSLPSSYLSFVVQFQ